MHVEPAISGHVYRRQGPRADVWYAKWRGADGRQHKRRLGPAWAGRGRPAAGYLTKRLAEDELRRVLEEEGAGDRPRRARLARSRSPRRPRSGCATSSSTGRASPRRWSTTARRLVPHLADARLLDMTPQAIERWRAHLTRAPKRPLSIRARNKALTVLHGVLERSRILYRLPTNPAADVAKLREQIDRTRFPAYDEWGYQHIVAGHGWSLLDDSDTRNALETGIVKALTAPGRGRWMGVPRDRPRSRGSRMRARGRC